MQAICEDCERKMRKLTATLRIVGPVTALGTSGGERGAAGE